MYFAIYLLNSYDLSSLLFVILFFITQLFIRKISCINSNEIAEQKSAFGILIS